MTDTLTPPPTRQFMRCENGHLLEFGKVTFTGERRWMWCLECSKDKTVAAERAGRKKYRAARANKRNQRSQRRSHHTNWIDISLKNSRVENVLRHAVMLTADSWHDEGARHAVAREYADRIGDVVARRRRTQVGESREDAIERYYTTIMQRAEAEYVAKDESKKPWKYLQIKPEARAAWDRFDSALEKARNTGEGVPNCDGKPELYSDYPEDAMPTGDEAFDLCYGCPLMEQCATFAELERPAYGIWAGDRWVAGDTVNDD